MRLRGFGFVRKRRHGGWQISYSVQGREIRESVARALHREPGICTEKDARDLLAQRLAELQLGPNAVVPGRLMLFEALDNYLAHLKLSGSKGYAIYASLVRSIKREIGRDMLARDLTAPLIKLWANRLLVTKKPGTVRLRCSVLRAALERARREQLLAVVPVFPSIRVNNARQGFFEKADFEKVVAALSPALADVARFGYLTGWRSKEILGLTWAQVDRRRREIRISDSKNGE